MRPGRLLREGLGEHYREDRQRRKREQLRAALQRWRARHREAHKIKRQLNRDKERARQRQWYEANRAHAFDKAAERRARKANAFVATVRRSEIFTRDQGLCGICQQPVDPDNWHLDHVMPLVLGGTHEPTNVQVTHPYCNRSKGGRPLG